MKYIYNFDSIESIKQAYDNGLLDTTILLNVGDKALSYSGGMSIIGYKASSKQDFSNYTFTNANQPAIIYNIFNDETGEGLLILDGNAAKFRDHQKPSVNITELDLSRLNIRFAGAYDNPGVNSSNLATIKMPLNNKCYDYSFRFSDVFSGSAAFNNLPNNSLCVIDGVMAGTKGTPVQDETVVIGGDGDVRVVASFWVADNVRNVTFGEGIECFSRYCRSGEIAGVIDFPSTTKIIGERAYEARTCERVICRAAVPPVLGGWGVPNTTDGVYVPDDSLSLYQADTTWRGYTLKPISQLPE